MSIKAASLKHKFILAFNNNINNTTTTRMAILATAVIVMLATSLIETATIEDYPVEVHIEAAPVDDRYDTLRV